MVNPADITVSRRRIHIDGIVQGVGFRPFVYRLARECRIAGTVCNDEAGVDLDVEGINADLDGFLARIRSEAPALAVIEGVSVVEDMPVGASGFRIVESGRHHTASTYISPDVATCDDCLRELFDKNDRRYRYPFINCTNCGPRYTIVRSIPYDRPNTSMDVFPLCETCRREYENPEDRRFHAQPNACAVCGPSLRLIQRDGLLVETDDVVAATIEALHGGAVVAIRGVGGFHLVVDATNDAAVQTLRRRKHRAHKPFAVMARDVDAIRQWCTVSPEEELLLRQPARPIVLLPRAVHLPGAHSPEAHLSGAHLSGAHSPEAHLPGAHFPGAHFPEAHLRTSDAGAVSVIAESVAPGQTTLGFMLPYTPLHHLLLDRSDDQTIPIVALVMTSANLAEEPIAIGNQEALDRLREIADFFVLHDREILQRCDDSVARVVRGRPFIMRRSRGYVPAPVHIPIPTPRPVLAVGGELKNTIALARGRDVFLSQHIGDLDNPSAFQFFVDSIGHLEALFEVEPEVVACDFHPEYLSTKWARRQGFPVVAVQHHHAHLASVLAENDIEGEALGLIFDGTGYGLDGTIWGGELLRGSARSFDRLAWLNPFPLPGGEAAIRQPWRTALGLLDRVYGAEAAALDLPVVDGHRDVLTSVQQMIRQDVNSPMTSSVGRLFDAVAAMCPVESEATGEHWDASRNAISYEAQAAILLEAIATASSNVLSPEPYDLPERAGRSGLTAASERNAGALPIDYLIRSVVEDIQQGTTTGVVAGRFHATVAALFVEAVIFARRWSRINRVGLSGGAFQNMLLFELVASGLERAGFEVLTHSRIPANDGGLAFGQCAVAAAQLNVALN